MFLFTSTTIKNTEKVEKNYTGMEPSAGIEPATLKLQVLCSIQMSYEETLFVTTVLDVIQRKRRRSCSMLGNAGLEPANSNLEDLR